MQFLALSLRTTLVHGCVEHGVNSGLVPYLNKEEEGELAIFKRDNKINC